MVLAIAWSVVGCRRSFLHAIDRRGMVCWECGHDLPGTDRHGHCPACDVDYDAVVLAERWDRPKGLFNRRWHEFPLVLRRRLVLLVGAHAGLIGAAGITLIALRVNTPPTLVPGMSMSAMEAWLKWQRSLAVGVGMLALAAPISTIWISITSSRLTKKAKALDGLMCDRCTYDLTGSGHSGACPECGRAFEAAALRRMWGVKKAPSKRVD